MENPENQEEKALVFAPKTLSLGCSLAPVMGEFGVIVKGGCHFFYSDQGPLLKGGGDVGGKYPGGIVFAFFVRMFRGQDIFMSNEAYEF